MKITLRTSCLALALSAVLAAPAPARAQEQQSAWGEAGIGLICFGATLFYGPVKTIYALAGTVVGGAAYVLTGADLPTAQKIWTPSLRGDYVISPRILRGEDILVFSGREPDTDEIQPEETSNF
jgi:hypothetical protein